MIAGAEILWVERRLFVRECDCFCFGTAMGGEKGSGVVAWQRGASGERQQRQ